MTEAQSHRLQTLIHGMHVSAGRQPTMNLYHRAHTQINALRAFLAGQPSEHTADEWIAIAERSQPQETVDVTFTDRAGIVTLGTITTGNQGILAAMRGDKQPKETT